MNHADYSCFEWLESYLEDGGQLQAQLVTTGNVELTLSQKGTTFHLRRPTLREAVRAAMEASEA